MEQLPCAVQDFDEDPEFDAVYFWDGARPWLFGRGLELYPFEEYQWCTPLFAAGRVASLPFATCGKSAVSKPEHFSTRVRVISLRRIPSTNLQRSGGLPPLGTGRPETACSS